MVYISTDHIGLRFTMCQFEVLINPCNDVVFKNTLDKLMQKIGGHQLMNVGSREEVGEWLNAFVSLRPQL